MKPTYIGLNLKENIEKNPCMILTRSETLSNYKKTWGHNFINTTKASLG